MKAVTVKQLAKQLNKLILEGKEDYQIFLTDDEECNGYHACWYVGTVIDEQDDKEFIKYIESINCDIEILENKNKAVYLG